MPIYCHTDNAHGAAVRGTLLCEGCYVDAMERVRRGFTRRGKSEPKAINKTAPEPVASVDELAEDQKLADVIARSVVAADGPVTRLDQRLRMRGDPRLSRGIALARAQGLIELDNGRGFVPGPKAPPPPVSPLELAHFVWAADGIVTYDDLVARYGISRRTLSRKVNPAREARWIVNVHGKGYARGPEKPPENLPEKSPG